ILGHHYQRDEVIQFADHTGDSYGLAKKAAADREAKTIVFCGVHFMAESADILASAEQRVILPDLEAGCSMADMAEIDQVEEAWERITSIVPEGEVMPVTYMNSTAALKAFCGTKGGAVCTSSNASGLFDWALARRPRLFFFPDQHLGRNVGVSKGISVDDMPLYDPHAPLGGLTREEIVRAKVILWKGHCQVHGRFTAGQVDYFRAKFPGINVIVHPECTLDVVRKADYVGSTSYIIKTIREASAGTRWVVGTEIHLVNRLRQENPDKLVTALVPGVCLCSTMNRIDPQHLLWVLESLERGKVVNEIVVPETVAREARLALDRMLQIS
ncbi:MAG: quinolinate synthase NadA, partial [Vicinamibacteria bacterium]